MKRNKKKILKKKVKKNKELVGNAIQRLTQAKNREKS